MRERNSDRREVFVHCTRRTYGPLAAHARPENASESGMYRLGEETHETTTEARGSVNVKGMTLVLGGGLVLVILAFVVIIALT